MATAVAAGPAGRRIALCMRAIGKAGGRTRIHALIASMVALPLQAADVPAPGTGSLNDPGRLLEQRERERRHYDAPEEQSLDDPGLDAERQRDDGKLPEGTGRMFVLRGVVFDESAFIASTRLERMAELYVGEQVTFADINDLVDAINMVYRRRGQITARAIVPPQRIEGGILRIRLVEGRVGRIEFEGSSYTARGFLQQVVAIEPGEVIDVPVLRDRIRTANRLTPLQIGAQLQAGDDFGESNVMVGVNEPARVTGQLFADNNGAESTGEAQYGVYAVWNGPVRRADQMSAYVVSSEGSSSISLTYAAPVATSGGRLSGTLAGSETEIVAGGFADFDITGRSAQMSLEYLAPGLSRGTITLDWLVRMGWLESVSETSGQAVSETTIERLALGVQLRGGTKVRWFLQQEVLFERSENLFDEREDHVRMPGNVSLTGRGPWGSMSRLAASWQYNDDPRLPSSGQFQIGGVGTVRGYESGSATAERGVAVGGELHWQTPYRAAVFVFADAGHVDGVETEDATLRSLGTGVQWLRNRWQADFTLAATLDDAVADQDDYRLHLRLSYGFASTS